MGLFSDLFKKRVVVSRPVATPVGQNLNYPNTPIVIQTPQAQAPGGGDTQQTIYRMLDEIGSLPIGAQLFQALTAAGKQIGVRYAGPNQNSAAGGVKGYVKLRQWHDAQDSKNFAQELGTTLHNLQLATGHDKTWVAQQLHVQHVPTWANQEIQPYGNPVHPGSGPLPQGATQLQIIEDLLDRYLAGKELPSLDELDALLLLLEDHLTPGAGVVTRIMFDPHKEIVQGKARPPHCGLFHELMHALYNAQGRQLGREDSIQEGNGGRLFEAMAVGLGLFGKRPLSENGFRAALGVSLRTAYP